MIKLGVAVSQINKGLRGKDGSLSGKDPSGSREQKTPNSTFEHEFIDMIHESIEDPLSNVFNQIMQRECDEHYEKWIVVRNALLCWPGPARKIILRYCELISHKPWILGWLKSSGNDESQTVVQVMNHLHWRVLNRIDSILDEVLHNCDLLE
jgi:hypothetical protein